ncbi:response regulator transcription factor [Clostridiaceae bacterium 68-1-5]|uniref:Stage 0 sporulation protein A homolog n=1 Tax=Suipraeoptans intestinalis TaxID=2606628 RepID=A0A6N7URL0_9FIRM|nr:response regulator transcription factor [Suipraeoptans intestinalis]MSR93363.1 response regulator transcription factor [Suipraeoptans intestinalis]
MNYKIMIIEDDPDIAGLLSDHLQRFGFLVYRCKDLKNVIEEFKLETPHLVLLDINLPVYNGFYWCNKIRSISPCPIIFLSARNTDSDQVHAIMNGGDDYITKPFSFEVVTAKISAVLRRTYGEYSSFNADELQCEDCIFSKSKLTLSCHGHMTELSKTEAGVIRVMFQNYPNIVSREELLNEIWDDESFVEENTLNVTISRIRKRLERIGSTLAVKPVRGVGYRIGDSRHEK